MYDIKVKSYNKLTGYSKAVPAFLALLTLPPFGEDWHLYSENAQLSIRQSLYWHFLGEEPEVPDSDSTKRIRLSRHHLVTSDWLVALFKALQAGQGIDSVLT